MHHAIEAGCETGLRGAQLVILADHAVRESVEGLDATILIRPRGGDSRRDQPLLKLEIWMPGACAQDVHRLLQDMAALVRAVPGPWDREALPLCGSDDDEAEP